MSQQYEAIKRVLWHCRRGMLELDMLLIPFCEHHFLSLSEQDQQHFLNLLACEDTELFSWFIGAAVPQNPYFKTLIQMIKDNVRHSA